MHYGSRQIRCYCRTLARAYYTTDLNDSKLNITEANIILKANRAPPLPHLNEQNLMIVWAVWVLGVVARCSLCKKLKKKKNSILVAING